MVRFAPVVRFTPLSPMINQQVKVGVANNDKRAKCWCGTGKVGVATATPAIRYSPPMIVGIIKLAGFVEALAEGNKLSTSAFLSDFPCDTFICFRSVWAQISY